MTCRISSHMARREQMCNRLVALSSRKSQTYMGFKSPHEELKKLIQEDQEGIMTTRLMSLIL